MVTKITKTAKEKSIERAWYLVDATGCILGRLATRVAGALTGKGKTVWSPNVDVGDFVVVVNAGKLRVTGAKLSDKKYYRHSGYLGGLKEETLYALLARKPERVVELAVKGMLPKSKLGRRMYKKLKVYRGADHPHAAQSPVALKI